MRFLRAESGVALIEFSLFLPMLALLFVGIVDYALELQQALQIQEAASAGAAYGATAANAQNLTGMQTVAKNAASGVAGFSATATTLYSCTPGGAAVSSSSTCTGYGTPITYVQVATSATVSAFLSFTGITSSRTIYGMARYRVPWHS